MCRNYEMVQYVSYFIAKFAGIRSFLMGMKVYELTSLSNRPWQVRMITIALQIIEKLQVLKSSQEFLAFRSLGTNHASAINVFIYHLMLGDSNELLKIP